MLSYLSLSMILLHSLMLLLCTISLLNYQLLTTEQCFKEHFLPTAFQNWFKLSFHFQSHFSCPELWAWWWFPWAASAGSSSPTFTGYNRNGNLSSRYSPESGSFQSPSPRPRCTTGDTGYGGVELVGQYGGAIVKIHVSERERERERDQVSNTYCSVNVQF